MADLSERNLHDFTRDLLRKSARRGVLALHIPNGIQGSDGKRAGRIQMAMGARKGASDWLVVINGRAGFMELKTAKGKQSIWQKLFERDVIEAGGLYAIARSPEEVIAILTKWGAIKKVTDVVKIGRAA